jgi:two-component system cell cycle sensor histidine kinase/response regulator CckA
MFFCYFLYKMGDSSMDESVTMNSNKESLNKCIEVTSDDFFVNIFNSLPHIIFVFDVNGVVIKVNKKIEDYGYAIDDLIGQTVCSICPEFLPFLHDITGIAKEIIFSTKWGRKVSVMASVADVDHSNLEVESSNGKNRLLILNELPTLNAAKKSQELSVNSLQQTNKIDAIGILAAGLAHDFNSTLSVISSNINVLKKLLIKDGICDKDITEYLSAINKSTVKARDITKKILGFARETGYEMQELNMISILNGITDILQQTIESNIKIITHFSDDLWMVVADSVQIMQVFMNLALNSRDAMPLGGEIFYKASNIIPSVQYCKTHLQLVPNKRYIKITVGDVGDGIANKHLDQMFEPFFTTKKEALGIGLSIVYGIINAHNGAIYVNSTIGVGTKFSIYLPAVESEVRQPVSKGINFTKIKSKFSKTVLIVDDEVLIRELTEAVLIDKGYKVCVASCVQEALEIIDNGNRKIDLVMIDVVMTAMNYYEFFLKLRKLKPKLPVLFCDVEVQSEEMSQLRLDKEVEFIQKPFSLDDLYYAIKSML